LKYSQLSKKKNNDLNFVVKQSTKDRLINFPPFPEKNVYVATVLSILENSEIIFELLGYVLSKKDSPHFAIRHMKWIFIALFESLKCILRFYLLVKNRGSMIVHRRIPSRSDESEKTEKFTMIDDDISKPTEANVQIILGEVLWIMRPILYLMSLFYYTRKSWKPWFISIIIDIASRSLTLKSNFNTNESKELKSRSYNLLLYLLRSPFFETFINPAQDKLIEKYFDSAFRVPLAYIKDILQFYRQIYFYSSGSN